MLVKGPSGWEALFIYAWRLAGKTGYQQQSRTKTVDKACKAMDNHGKLRAYLYGKVVEKNPEVVDELPALCSHIYNQKGCREYSGNNCSTFETLNRMGFISSRSASVFNRSTETVTKEIDTALTQHKIRNSSAYGLILGLEKFRQLRAEQQQAVAGYQGISIVIDASQPHRISVF